MIDVIEQIKPLLVFNSEDDFYYLQILQRKKENPHLGSNSRVIKNYNIKSVEQLEDFYDEIKQLCQVFNARAMLRLNKRSFEKVAFKTLINISNSMANKEFSFIKKSYSRACGNGHNNKCKKWILDIDNPYNLHWLELMKKFINKEQPEGDKIIAELPTKNGVHLITKPFNLKEFGSVYPAVEVHKDNPVNLYIP